MEKHRSRLAREADKQVEAYRAEIEALVAKLSAKRDELVEARRAAIWARLYPSRAAGITAPTSVAGGRRKALERANIQGQLVPERMWELVIADAEHHATALTEEQAAELGLKGEDTEAVWAGTAEGPRGRAQRETRSARAVST